jgi:hypothetical protein
MRIPEVELLWWEGCPSTDRALGEVRQALDDMGLGEVEVHMREITTDADAEARSFAGSPTILIDGVDVVPAASEQDTGLGCRVYHRRDGRISPTPDSDGLREALRRAAERVEVRR